MGSISRFLLPPPQLSACLFAAVYRDTRGVSLASEDRINHFPASPLVSVTLVLHGELRPLPTGHDWREAKDQTQLPRLSVMGPQDAPVASWAPGEVVAVSFGFYPDAWFCLGGDVAFSQVPTNLVEVLEHFSTAQDLDTGWVAFCDALDVRWMQKRPTSWRGVAGIADWARAVVTRAALSGSGRSLRSLERRIRRFTGQSRRSLDFYSDFENLHRISRHSSNSPLAEIASEAGYADQSHMGRVVRRATGFSPAHLNRAIESEEAFWCYRLLGERF